MTDLEQELRYAVDQVQGAGGNLALVGGLAVSARSEPRLTRDADLAVAVTDDREAEDLLIELRRSGYTVVAIVEHRASGRIGTARLSRTTLDEGIVVDLLFASSGIEPEIVDAAERIEILPSFAIPVARTGHLIVMKLLARDDRLRPADADDLRHLAAVATAEEWDLARAAASLVVERGFHRDRDLHALIDELRHGTTTTTD